MIDAMRAPGWKGYLQTWALYNSDTVAGPSKNISCTSWFDWFSLDDNTTQMRLSPLCKQIDKPWGKSRVYRMTGNFYGCIWYNRNCDQSGLTCNKCKDNYHPNPSTSGTCTHLVYGPCGSRKLATQGKRGVPGSLGQGCVAEHQPWALD